MSLIPDVVFVGQGPNRKCWERGLELGRRIASDYPESFAVRYCRRLSLTGRVGRSLAELCDMDLQEFRSCFDRRNLNDRWLGKKGRGDLFDREQGKLRAQEINSSGFRRFVLLGANVAECFGFEYVPLKILQFPVPPHSYLLLPHPSGANAFWNSAQSRRCARAVLRGFLELDEPMGVPRPAETAEYAAIRSVQEQACRTFGIQMADLLSPSSKQPLSSYRMAAMAMAREVSGASYPDIAHAFGRTHHRSAIRAWDAAQSHAAKDENFRLAFDRFRAALPVSDSVPGTAE